VFILLGRLCTKRGLGETEGKDSLLTEGWSSFVSSFNGRRGMGSTSEFMDVFVF
jgi:hypothetical protein